MQGHVSLHRLLCLVDRSRPAHGSCLWPPAASGRVEPTGFRNCRHEAASEDQVLSVSKVASNSSGGVPGIGHEESLDIAPQSCP